MTKENRKVWIFFLLVLLAPITLFCAWNYLNENIQPLPYVGGSVVRDGREIRHTVPSFSLTSEQGKVYVSDQDSNKISVVNFFFSTCPTICPKMTNNLQVVNEVYKNDKSVVLLSITVDPETDSPGILRQYKSDNTITNERWHFLTGNKKDIYRLARNGYFITAAEGDGGPNDFIHSENIVLVDGNGHIRGYYNGTEEKEMKKLIKDISRLKKEL